MTPLRLAASLAAASLAAACAVGPDYRSAPPAVGTGTFVGATPGLFSAEAPPADWWRLYREPALDALVAEALANNKDLAVASANLAQVRASLSEARAGRWPTTAIAASAARTRLPSPATGAAVESEAYSAGLDVAYEVDLFGRRGRTIEAARADAEAAAAALDVVRVSVAAETARAYADACAGALQIAVATRSRDLLDQSAALTQRQLDAGRGTGLDVSRAQALARSAQAAIPPLQAARDAALFRLAVLVGRPPAEVSEAARACQTPPTLAATLPVGDGAGLLRRRPDVRQAERRLAAATARIGVATADLYPSISLGGSITTTGGEDQNLGSDYQFSVGPLIRWSFPNIGAARARIARADAAAQGALASFDQATLLALQEAETALSAYTRELDRRAALVQARDQSARAVTLSRMRQQAGLDSFLTVLDAERTLVDLEAQLAQSEAAVTTRQIALFKALGGGWEAPAPAA